MRVGISGFIMAVTRSLVFGAVLVLLTSCGGGLSGGNGSGTGTTGGTTTTPSSPPQHIVVVFFENQDYASVVGSPYMPYWNQLASQNAQATQFYADVHPSLGNYFWMTAAQDPTVGLSDPDNFTGTISGDNVASVLAAAGKTWKVYAQSIPNTGYTGEDVYPYLKHHNPFVYFDSVLNSSTQLANIVSFSQLSVDLSASVLPAYSLIVPDVEHDGHDCPNGGSSCQNSDKLSEIDSFLKNDLSPLLNNSAVMSNTVVILTFDESADDNTMGGGRIPVVVIGGPVKSGYQSTATYQFQSLLRFSLESLGLHTFPGDAQNAAGMSEFLK
jgi:acid phosphatase